MVLLTREYVSRQVLVRSNGKESKYGSDDNNLAPMLAQSGRGRLSVPGSSLGGNAIGKGDN